MTPRRGATVVVAAALAAATVGTGLRALRTAGTRGTEPSEPLPGDALLPDAHLVTTRATTIAASAQQLWPWLVQMGYRRGGWYAIDQLERLLGVGDFLTGGSARTIVPELQTLAVGDPVPLSATLHLEVRVLEPGRALVLELVGTPLAWVWSFVLRPGADGVRLLVRTRVRARSPALRWLLPLLDAGHAAMELVQLRRLRARAEGYAGPHGYGPTSTGRPR